VIAAASHEGDAMFNRDGMFNKKESQPRKDIKDAKQPVNLTPGLGAPAGHSAAETSHMDSHQAPETVKSPSRSEAGTGSKLIVGPDIKLKGAEITDCDTLVVEGRVEASMDSRVIQIAEHGVFAGTVGIDIAEIHGRFEGELTARKQLVVHASGKVSGKIRYGKISIAEGGEVSGDVSSLTTAAATAKSGDSANAPADIMTAYDPFARKTKPALGKPTPA
jgi:cytoskeletal protein CcmA (bactofilin family)